MLSCALVARDGSIDWLCLPRFDSDACFAALLGDEENGYWRIAPAGDYTVSRQYRDGTTILETTFETADGAVTLIDFMPLGGDEEHVNLMRLVRGDRGRVAMRMEFVLRFGYGTAIPWVRRRDFGLSAVAGPDGIELHTDVPLTNENMRTTAEFVVGEGATVPFTLCYHPSHRTRERAIDPPARLAETEAWWREWSGRCTFQRRPRASLARGRGALAGDAEGADLRAQRRHRGGGDHLAARAARGRAQLGLPLLLDPRRHGDALCAAPLRLSRGGARVAPLDAARQRRPSAAVADHVRACRRAPADRADARLARRLRGLAAGQDRQRRLCAASARRLWRDPRRARMSAASSSSMRRTTAGSSRRSCSRTSRANG